MEAIVELERWWGERTRVRRLGVSHAFHSPMMEPMLAEFETVCREVTLNLPRIPLVSNVTGAIETELFTDPGYWVEHVRKTVRFADGIEAARALGGTRFIEIGPDAVLAPMISRIVGPDAAVVAMQRRGRDQVAEVIRGLAEAYCHGVGVDWRKFYAGTGARTVDLPTYAFQRQRYWPTAAMVPTDVRGMGLDGVQHPWLAAAVSVADTGETLVTGRLAIAAQPWLADHVVLGSVLLPGTGLVELAGAAGQLVGRPDVVELALEAPLVFDRDVAVTVQVRVAAPDPSGMCPVSVFSRPCVDDADDEAAGWVRHAHGVLSTAGAPAADAPEPWPPHGATAASAEGCYEDLAKVGFEYGDGFRGVRAVWWQDAEVWSEIELPERARGRNFGVHPAIFDAAFHPVIAQGVGPASDGGVLLPFVFRGVRVFRRGVERVRVRIRVADGGVTHLTAWDGAGRAVWSMERLEVRRADAAMLRSGGAADVLLTPVWQPVATPEGSSVVPRATVVGEVPADCLAGLEVDGRYAGIAELSAAVAASGAPWPPVVLCAAPEVAADGPAAVRAAVAELLHGLQQWFAAPGASTGRLIVLTRNAFGIGDPASGSPAGAALSGLLRSVQAEYPGRVTSVDVDERATPDWPELLSIPEPRLAVRGRALFTERLVRTESAHRPVDFGEGTVLITGGTGGLGAVLARHLVTEHGVRHLVLASRRGPDADGVARLRSDLESAGATVDVVAADVCERAAVHELIGSIPRLTAVMHAAGILADGTIETLTTDQLDRVMRPKVDAAWYLDEATRDLDLSAFVLFSSAAPLLGGAGQGNYAAANAVLDELARSRRARGLAGTSLAWGLWDAEAGMAGAADPAEFARLARVIRDRLGLHPLTPAEGSALFDAAMATGAPVVAPVKLDFPGLRAAARNGRLHPMLRSLIGDTPTAAPQASLAAELAGLTERQRESHVLNLVRARAAAALGYAGPEAVEPDQSFQDLGFDSLAGIELRNGIAQATGITLPVTVAFDHPTPAAIARYLLDQVVVEAAPAALEMTDEDLRHALRSVPLAELRRAGIVELLSGLSGNHDGAKAHDGEKAADASPADLNAIAEMDAGQLIEFAARYEAEA
ncbi:SDR family NAD(P)-dependent oxidoreductase [Nocardia veterana]|uniref:type I polyketide synthase n=1 Tax=Nocardia veterana TaxID=132249 RepID=UPI00289C9D43|nr:SDR family NAD(P)-dependent oxidoreductase [Nocardia veterana]